jgi:hypothetical protein
MHCCNHVFATLIEYKAMPISQINTHPFASNSVIAFDLEVISSIVSELTLALILLKLSETTIKEKAKSSKNKDHVKDNSKCEAEKKSSRDEKKPVFPVLHPSLGLLGKYR